MGKGIEINLLANTRAFVAGTDDAADALDKVADSLDDVAKDAKTAADKSERGLAMIADEAQDTGKSLDRLESNFRDLADQAQRSSREAGDSLDRNVKSGAAHASEGVQSFKEEAIQNFSETASSFDGSMQGAADGVQGLFGGLASSLPLPLGIAAGTIGLLFGAALQKMADDTEKVKEKASELAAEWIETGRVGESSAEFVADALKTMATNLESGTSELAELYRNFRKTGQQGVSSFDDVAQAYAGAGGDLDGLVSKQKDYLAQLEATRNKSRISTEETRAKQDQIDSQQKIVDGLVQAKSAADDAALAQKAYAQSGAAELQAKADAIQRTNDLLKDGADNWEDYVDEASGAFDVNKYIEDYNKLAETITQAASAIENSTLPEAAKAYLQSLPPQQQAAYVAAYKAGNPAQQAQLASIWQANGQASGAQYVQGLSSQIPPTLNGPRVVLSVDDSGFQKTIKQLTDKTYQIRFKTDTGGVRTGTAIQ